MVETRLTPLLVSGVCDEDEAVDWDSGAEML
jgi:hypothetical protein